MLKIYMLLIFSLQGVVAVGQSTYVVTMQDYSFSPADVTIHPGDEVIWENRAGISHTSVSGSKCSPDGEWNSGYVDPAHFYTRIFATEGVYPYFDLGDCAKGMTGVIRVQSVSGIKGFPNTNSRAFEIYPNPAVDKIYVRFSPSKSGSYLFRVYDMTGREVVPSQTGIAYIGQNGLNTLVGYLSPGAYVVRLEVGDEIYYDRFIKQ